MKNIPFSSKKYKPILIRLSYPLPSLSAQHTWHNDGYHYHSTVLLPDEGAENHIGEMLGDHIVILDLLDHLDVELLLPLRELGLQHHEEVVPVLVLVCRPLGEGRHAARGEIDPALQLPRSIVEQEHVGVVLSAEVFQPADDGERVEGLSVEGGVLGEVVVDLVECEWDDGLVVDRLVVLLLRVGHLAPDLIIYKNAGRAERGIYRFKQGGFLYAERRLKGSRWLMHSFRDLCQHIININASSPSPISDAFFYYNNHHNHMKSDSPKSRSRVHLSSSQLDPLQLNELIVEQRLILPLVSSLSEPVPSRPHPLIFKMTRDKNQDKLVIFLLSEVDLYFLYRFDLSYVQIAELNSNFKLSLKRLGDLVQLLRGSLEEVSKGEKQAEVELTEQGVELVIRRTVGGKSHTVLAISGREEIQQVIRAQVAYRYGALRERISRKEERIGSLRETVRQKYPHLLKNFKQI